MTALDEVDLLIGIDDTDDLTSPGTGRRCRGLIDELTAAGLGTSAGATRHQLLVHPDVPYTSHNSSACIAWRRAAPGVTGEVIALAGAFLERHSAAAADPGLAVAEPAAAAALIDFGRSAQRDVLHRAAARELAAAAGVHLSGHGGTQDGVIGALAAVGLHRSGADGLFLDLPGVRELGGRRTWAQVRAQVPIDDAVAPDGAQPRDGDVLDLGDWVRPLLLGGRTVLLLQAPVDGVWAVAPRAVVKARSAPAAGVW